MSSFRGCSPVEVSVFFYLIFPLREPPHDYDHRLRLRRQRSRENDPAPSKRTAASIAEIGATILLHTTQEVDTSALRPNGRYLPKSQKSGGPIAAEDGLAATLTLDTQQAASSRRSR